MRYLVALLITVFFVGTALESVFITEKERCHD